MPNLVSSHSVRDKHSDSNRLLDAGSRHRGKIVSTNPKDFKRCWSYKYVRFDDGRVLFCDAADMNTSHKHVVGERTDAQAISAGIIKVHRWHDHKAKWAITQGGSFTTNLARLPDDEEHISRELGEQFIYDSSLN